MSRREVSTRPRYGSATPQDRYRRKSSSPPRLRMKATISSMHGLDVGELDRLDGRVHVAQRDRDQAGRRRPRGRAGSRRRRSPCSGPRPRRCGRCPRPRRRRGAARRRAARASSRGRSPRRSRARGRRSPSCRCRSVGGMGDVDDDRDVGMQSRRRVVIAPPRPISSCETASAGDADRGRIAGGDPARDLERDVGAEAVVERRWTRAGRWGATSGSAASTAGSPTLTRPSASSRSAGADVDVHVLDLGGLLAVLLLEQVDRLLADHAGDLAVVAADDHPLADEVLRVPAADRAEPEEALVVDVADEQADLVDVADDGDRRPALAASRPGRPRSRARRVRPRRTPRPPRARPRPPASRSRRARGRGSARRGAPGSSRPSGPIIATEPCIATSRRWRWRKTRPTSARAMRSEPGNRASARRRRERQAVGHRAAPGAERLDHPLVLPELHRQHPRPLEEARAAARSRRASRSS